jgi:hypothetical protein
MERLERHRITWEGGIKMNLKRNDCRAYNGFVWLVDKTDGGLIGIR